MSALVKGEEDDDISRPLNGKRMPLKGRVCVVCGEAAPSGQVFRGHYGVVCCEACKCFFRRTVQMKKHYQCRASNECCAFVNNSAELAKIRCQACRFRKCIDAGMKVDAVKGRGVNKVSSRHMHQEPQHYLLPVGTEITTHRTVTFAQTSPEDTYDMTRKRVRKPTRPARNNQNEETWIGTKHEESLGNSEDTEGRPVQEVKTILDVVVESPQSKVIKLESDGDLDSFSPMFALNVQSPNTFMNSVIDSSMKQLEKVDDRRLYVSDTLRPTGDPSSSSENSSNKPIVSDFSPSFGPFSPQKYNSPHTSEDGFIQAPSSNSLRELSTALISHVPANNKSAGIMQGGMNRGYSKGHSPLPISGTYNSRQQQQYTRGIPMQTMMGNSHHPSSSGIISPYDTPVPSVNNTPYGTPLGSPCPTPIHGTPAPTPILGTTPCPTPNLSPAPSPGPMGVPHSMFGHDNMFQRRRFQSTTSINPPMTHPIISNAIHSNGNTGRGSGYMNYHEQQPPFSSFYNNSGLGGQPQSSLPLSHGTLPPSNLSSSIYNEISVTPFEPIPGRSTMQPLTLNTTNTTAGHPPTLAALVSPTRSSIAGVQSMPEAEVDEVLDSLRQRIRHMFKWAKTEVAGFDDLSPLDQKALLRRTVSELVMLGIARLSVSHTGVLILGQTGKVITSAHENSGVATVASLALVKLLIPLKHLKIDDTEYALLKEIVLFNPESNGIRNRDMIRQHRKKRLTELMEYTKNAPDPGRYGEVLCLLTPLYEVSLEVTEQLRLEQYVNEGEARIDAHLLMSMINDIDYEMPLEASIH